MSKAKALLFASKAHEGQTRKGTGYPYIMHPVAVGHILDESGFSDEVVMAGYLHDTVEDTAVTREDLLAEFGLDVSELVMANTENKQLSWEERKQHTIEFVAEAPVSVRAIIVADKLDNLKALIKDYETFGDEVWTFFKRGRDKQQWYYTSIAKKAFSGLEPDEVPDLFHIFKEVVDSFFNNKPAL
ncbi:phosphohydrolase [Bacillus sp. FJAT-27225]|uniref:HD domain-containing protein n=1 Tax=Bacillus sp. FJAT-27225 TaxID=1743144 RepID=UPI00080C20F0|nr:HD domain-containing protein [Bacillus sp. FJAT-27225]OCA81534.1 phosphohydrolase [Bacillus sp. FJAT-27225]